MENRNKSIVITAIISLIVINIVIFYVVGLGIKRILVAQTKVKEIESTIHSTQIVGKKTIEYKNSRN